MKQIIGQINYLACHRISWERPKKKRSGPTTCHRCAMHGHGMSGCYRGAVCVFCGAGHTLAECNLIETANATPSCAHCAAKDMEFEHRADDSECPHLIEYADRRNRPKQNPNQVQASSHEPVPSYRQSRRVPSPSPVRHNNTSVAGSGPGSGSYSDVVKGRSRSPARSRLPGKRPVTQASFQIGANKSYSSSLNMLNAMFEQQQEHPPDETEQLLSNQELFSILMQAIEHLRRCRNRLDQTAVIAYILSQCH